MSRSRINPENNSHPPPCCTLCIFYPSHFTPSHFPHSPFSTLIRFEIRHFLHSSFLHSASSALRTPSISPNPLLATIFSIKVCSALKLTTENEEKLSFRTCWESSSNLRSYKHYIGKGFLSCPKSKIRCVHYSWPIVLTFCCRSCVARAEEICASWRVSKEF